jgi:hypothetical protein
MTAADHIEAAGPTLRGTAKPGTADQLAGLKAHRTDDLRSTVDSPSRVSRRAYSAIQDARLSRDDGLA